MPKFISCDWGTSALRLRVIDVDKVSVLAEAMSVRGISNTFELWKQSGKQNSERLSFYQSVLTEQVRKMEEQLKYSLQDVPLIVSGMASSSIGMMELPYKEVPFSADGHDLFIKIIEATDQFPHKILLISGVRTMDDVMRGEETQLIGCLSNSDIKEQLFIFPGTHSKHVIVKEGEVVDIKTYMTGEFFELLAKKSILSDSVEEARDLSNADTFENFEKGVADSLHLSLLHSSFLVRTNQLLNKLPKKENWFYLSGLVIGTELKELINIKTPVTIVSDEFLIKLYSIALVKLGIDIASSQNGDKATVEGHCRIYNSFRLIVSTGAQ